MAPRFSVGAGEPIEKNTVDQTDSTHKQERKSANNSAQHDNEESTTSEGFESANETNDKSLNKSKQKSAKVMETSTRSTCTRNKAANETVEAHKEEESSQGNIF